MGNLVDPRVFEVADHVFQVGYCIGRVLHTVIAKFKNVKLNMACLRVISSHVGLSWSLNAFLRLNFK
jgi:hypothetical protein